jgi:predicted DNA-binding transcriptional regulator AlpA
MVAYSEEKSMRGNTAVPQEKNLVRGELLTATQVGERLKLSEKTLYNWKRTGELPIDYFYIHGNLRFDSADVDDYIALSKNKSPKAQLVQAILQCGDVDPRLLLEEWLEPIVKKIIKTGGVGMKK